MNTGREGETLARLLTALAELAVAEAVQVEGDETLALDGTQRRIAAVIERLSEFAAGADDAARARLAEITAVRRHTGKVLTNRLAQLADQLGSARRHQRQLARMAPVYRQGEPAPTRFAQSV